jgi:alkylation response protein AidB-like acyl-CoA dehydrogenase
MTTSKDATTRGPMFPELESLLIELLPAEWLDAAAAGDEERVLRLRRDLDKPATVRRLGEQGWVAPHWPTAYGGRGLTEAEAVAVYTRLDELEVPRIPRGSGLLLAAPTILQWASDATKRRFLPALVTGAERWSQLFSEPGAGSDLASLATSAVSDGDEWIINGQKVWTTMGHESEFAMLLARTDTTVPKHPGITYFGVDMSSPGVEVRPLINIAGQYEFNEVFLTDVRVPDLHRISPVGDGWGAAQTTLGAERHALSGARKKRKSSDEILGGKTWADVAGAVRAHGLERAPLVRQRLADEHTNAQLLKMTAQRAKANRAAGRRAGPEGSISKIAKAASNQSLQLLAMDVLGAAAIAWDDGSESADFVTQMLRTRANSIEGGTSEIQRNIVGERVLGLPREPDAYRGRAWNDTPRS